MRRKDGGWTKLCIWIVKDLLWQTKKKKDGFDWIVDLKLSKKLKGKWKKKMGVAELWIWIYIETKGSCEFEKCQNKKKEKKNFFST